MMYLPKDDDVFHGTTMSMKIPYIIGKTPLLHPLAHVEPMGTHQTSSSHRTSQIQTPVHHHIVIC